MRVAKGTQLRWLLLNVRKHVAKELLTPPSPKRVSHSRLARCANPVCSAVGHLKKIKTLTSKAGTSMTLKQVPACHAPSHAMYSLSLKHAGQ
jgi:hypothetical protein